ncbi:Nucleoside-diphosphate-sugar epimerase [Streptoalloteichus tenebrarius]|uniref:Nucleoside-diphosphate-sugar epimerase n=1 Tax=Streptoalloteichus tenebrarius (strain ATCC 17920 / DSM 40477 / JCM 4838 / CBS 697.72 / NBRC 16177 / NCIMB 11028 / NRRL B-12390 / A12253. 1 / ISP 5477) TaxID=1933 RepID=A0ABT1HYH2_STRSD|nr:Nucleoside-diphosphate-sugar epimerase [Streptoalloteichus tenebrarius]
MVIAGGHGKIALRLERLLAERGDVAVGLVRNPDHVADLHAAGADAVVCDLEEASVNEVAAHLAGADAVVFAAGAGPGSGAARKDTVDRAAAALVADACHMAEIRRYLLVSAMGLDRADQRGTDEVFAAYLRAKAASEEDLSSRDLDWTVLRPGRLTDEPGSGLVRLGASVPPGEVSRDDVARVLVALLDEPRSARHTLELVGGSDPVDEAVAAAIG